MEKSDDQFEKYYIVDTNIILHDARAIMTLSDNAQNLIIIPETVLDEIDAKKNGFEEINYQAREFGRLLSDAQVISMNEGNNNEYKIIKLKINHTYNVRIDIISKETYKADAAKSLPDNIRNDRKILEIAKFAQKYYLKDDNSLLNSCCFVSLDIMARTRAISVNIPTNTLLGTNKDKCDFEFHKIFELNDEVTTEELQNREILSIDNEYKYHNFSYSFKLPSGRVILSAIHNNQIELLDEDELRRQFVAPKNTEQLFFSNAILDSKYQIVIVDAKAGCVTKNTKIKIQYTKNIDIQEKTISIGTVSKYLKKYTNVNVETNTGFQPIKEYHEKGTKKCYTLIFEDDLSLDCSFDHFIVDVNNNFWSPENLITDDGIFPKIMFQTTMGPKRLLEIIEIGKKEIVDLEIDNDDHLYFTNDILSHNSGKTLLALSGAMKLVRKKQYSKIVYIRNSIESLDRGEEIGFLSGNEEKFKIYNHPLMDCIEFIVRIELKKSINNKAQGKISDIDHEMVKSKIEETLSRYSIETIWPGEARGRTISDSIVIIDEAQNMSNKTMQLILTRIDSSCKVIVLGSTRQIDNFFINKYTNGLTTLLNSTQNKYDGINLFSITLNKVLRGPITEWAENIFSAGH